MSVKNAIKLASCFLAVTSLLTLAAPAFAGGFWIEIEAPTAHDGEMNGAAVLVRTVGCHQPWDAAVSARAEGIVNGKRQTIPLELTRTSKGVYAIKQQWPSKGAWVVAVTSEYNGFTSSALVEMGTDGRVRVTKENRLASRVVQRRLTAQEVDAALSGLANNAV